MTFVTLRFRSLRALPSAPSTFGSQRSHHSAPNINSFLKTVTDFMKMLSGLGHPSFKSLAAYKNNKNVTDSFSKFFFPSKGPTEDIILPLKWKLGQPSSLMLAIHSNILPKVIANAVLRIISDFTTIEEYPVKSSFHVTSSRKLFFLG